MRRGRAAGFVSIAAAIVALVCGVLSVLAVNTLNHAAAADRTVVSASGPSGAGGGSDAGAAQGGSAATIPAGVSVNGPAAPPVTTLSPQRNPPLMAQGSEGDDVRELQVRLAHLGHFDADVTGYFGNVTASAVRAYQQRRGVEPTAEIYEDLWTALRSETPQPTQDELYPPPPAYEPSTVPVTALDPRCATGRVLCIDKTDSVLRWVVNGKVLQELDARFGRPGMETGEGQFSVYWKHIDHVSSIYEAEMPFSMFFNGGEAVHYSSDFAAEGYSGASHGCVNIRDYDGIAWLYDQVRTGDKVIIYWS